MADSTDVAKAEASAVPALVNTPSVELTAEDVALPDIKLGQFMSEHVQDKLVEPGSIFSRVGKEDPDPVTLWEQGGKDLVTLHPLAMRKGKSVSEDGELVLFAFDDPEAPKDAWVTYNYVVALPEVDQEMPYKLLLTRTGKPAAQQLNTVIAKNQASGPAYQLAFTLDCVERSNKKGKYFVPRIRHVEATAENIKIAEQLAAIVASQPTPEPEAAVEQPGI